MSVAWPRSFGPDDAERDADAVSATTATTSIRSGRSSPSSRLAEGQKLSDFSAGMPAPPIIAARPPPGRPIGPRRGVGDARRARRGSCRHLLGGTLRLDDLGVRRAALEQLLVGADARPPRRRRARRSGRRRRCVDTRWATMMTVALAGDRLAARRAAAHRWRGRGRRTSRRTGRSRAGGSTARAIASRWRWPPETLVPPWATSASSPSGMRAHEVVGLRDPQRRPHLVLGGVGLAVAQVVGDRAGEQVRLLRHQPDARVQDLGVELAHVDAVDAHAAPGRVEQARDQRARSVVLPAPVLPMIAVVCPAAAVNDTSQTTGSSAPG